MKKQDIRIAQDRFYSRKWGVFNHFLYVLQNNPSLPNSYGKQTDWDTLVNEFDIGVYRDGKFDQAQMDVLKAVGRAL